MVKRNLKINYWGFLGFLGFLGFQDPWYFLFFAFFLFAFTPQQSAKNSSNLIENQAKEKEEHLQKIRDFIDGEEKITNDDIQKLLGVSDSTAQRYLAELVKNGILKKQGNEGHIFYTK